MTRLQRQASRGPVYGRLKTLKGIKKILIDIFNLSYKVIYGHARWILAAVIATICTQMLCRNILRINTRWNREVALLFMIWMVFLGIVIGAEKNLYIGVELSYDKFPIKIRNMIDVLNQTTTLLTGAFFTVYRARMVLSTTDLRLPVAKWSLSPMYAMIPISGVATIYFMVLDIIGLKKYKKADDAGKFNREEEEKE